MSLNLAVQLNFMVIAIAGVLGTLAIAFVQEKHAYYNTIEKPSDAEKCYLTCLHKESPFNIFCLKGILFIL